MRTLIIILLCLPLTSGFAQIADSAAIENPLDNYNIFDIEIVQQQTPLSIGIRQINLSYEGVKGTPWLFEKDQEVEMIIDNGDTLVRTKAQIYLDIYKHEVLAALPNNQYYKLTGTQVKDITFIGQQRKFKSYTVDELDERAEPYVFAEILHEGKITLVKVSDKKLRKADYNDSYGQTGTRYDEFLQEERYWLKTDDNPFKKLKLKKNALLKALPNYESQIKGLLKQKKISILDEKIIVDLLQAIE